MASVLAPKLGAFLFNAAGRRFEPGVWDCGTMVADWIVCASGFDPSPEIRGLPEGKWEQAARRFPVLMARIAKRCGFPRTSAPELGDVATLRLRNNFIGAIRAKSGWAVVLESGIACGPMPSTKLVAAWRVHG